MPVPDSPSRRLLFALLSLAIVSGCMADAQPEFPQLAPFAPQPGQAAEPSWWAPAVARNAPQQGEWIVAPPLRASSADPYAAAPLLRLQPPLESSPAWMTGRSEPVRMPQASAPPPLRRDAPMLRFTPPIAPLPTNNGPANNAPAQAAWNVAPSVSVKPTPAQAEQIQSVRAPSAESGRTIATEPHVPSPDSGTIIALP